MKLSLRILSLCLLLALMLTSIASCEKKKRETTTTSSSSTAGSTTTLTPSTTVTTTVTAPVTTTTTTPAPTTTTTTPAPTTTTERTPTPFDGLTVVEKGSAYAIYDLAYGDRVDMSTKASKAASQIYDVYLPALPDKLAADTPVLLYVHGGSWSDPSFDKGVDGPWLCQSLAEKGMLVFTMNYVLQNTGGTAKNATVEHMLADIDAMVTHLADLLPLLGVEASAIGIGGTSAGGHLSTTYAYKYGPTAALDMGFVLDIVGPTDLVTYKKVVDHLISYTGSYAAADQFLRSQGVSIGLFAGMAGVEAKEENLAQMWDNLRDVSATTFLSADVCPTILAYAQTDNVPIPSQYLPAGFKSDGLVDVSCYTAMVEGLTQYGVPHAAQLYEGFGHGDMGWKKPASTWIISQTLAFAREYLS